MKPHRHAEIIHAYAEGAQVEYLNFSGEWCSANYPDFDPEVKYRIKPEPPKYPLTRYSETELAVICHDGGRKKPSLTDVANAAIARCIQDGDVVPSYMLEKIVDRFAEKIANDFADRYPGPNGYSLMPSEWESIAASQKVKIRAMLNSIIDTVKQGK